MNAPRKLFIYFLFIMLCWNPNSVLHCQNTECVPIEYCDAYQDTCRSAHWSAYIPLVAIIASAAFFGWADTQSPASSKSSYAHNGHFSDCSYGGSYTCYTSY